MAINKHLVILVGIAALANSNPSCAQTEQPPPMFGAAKELPLYPGIAPGSEKWDYSEVIVQGKSGPQVKNVVRPTLLYFPAAHPVGTAMIVAPGGARNARVLVGKRGFPNWTPVFTDF